MLDDIKFDIHVCANNSVSAHFHDFFELAYVTKGRAINTLNGFDKIISAGDYFILDYNARHSYSKIDGNDFEVINCLFVSDFIDNSLKNCKNFSEVVNNYMIKYSYRTRNISPANYIFHDENSSVKSLLNSMLNEYSQKKSGYIEILRCKLIEIIILAMRENTTLPTAEYSELCQFIIEYAEKNLTDKNILGTISKKVNFSISHLSRKFKEDTGIPFSEYLKQMRIEHACRLLLHTNKKITEIAALVGYSDIKFFNGIFKQQLGMTPRESRKYT